MYQGLHNVSPPKIISIWFSPITFRCKNLAPWYFNSPTKGRILLKYQKYCLAVNFDMNSILVWIIWLFLILIHTEYFYFLGGETLCKPWYLFWVEECRCKLEKLRSFWAWEKVKNKKVWNWNWWFFRYFEPEPKKIKFL